MSGILARLSGVLAERYRLERELGAGGMATVYLAQDLRHDRKVALKVLRPELAAVIGAERFLAEIKLTANLQHPHILPLFDSGAADSFLFYVMPFIEGESLRDRLRREKQLPVDEAVRIATEVASALDYAHRHGVIHRDIKPENILLHDGSALVADFGIALAASKAGGDRMTETGMSLGTPHYMSPEQATGEREITARSDVYALGAVLYEMLTGDPPFTGSTAQAVVARVVTESPRPLLPQRHTIPPHVEAAVLTALEKLPADRFATAAQFAEALADSRRTLARTQVNVVPAPAQGRWRRNFWAATGVALVLLAFGAWGWIRAAAGSRQSAVLAVRLAGRQRRALAQLPRYRLVPGRLEPCVQGRAAERPALDQAAGRPGAHAHRRDRARPQPGLLTRRRVDRLRRGWPGQEGSGGRWGDHHAGGLGRRGRRRGDLARRRNPGLHIAHRAGIAPGQGERRRRQRWCCRTPPSPGVAQSPRRMHFRGAVRCCSATAPQPVSAPAYTCWS